MAGLQVQSAMLIHTFQHLKGIGPVKESAWWRQGILTWFDLLQSAAAQPRHEAALRESICRLEARDARYFADTLPSAERWRIYHDFAADTVFLDIETTGLSPAGSHVTVVGLLDISGYRAFIRGDNMDGLAETLARYKLIVTFNGAAFDLPFLAAEFGADIFSGAAHVDLRHVLGRLGYRGGLKRIERMTSTGRSSVLANLGGADAVTLWRMSQDGEPGAMPTLVRYNAEDVASLPRLAALAVKRLSEHTPASSAGAPQFPPYDCSVLPYDRSLVDYLGQRKAYYSS